MKYLIKILNRLGLLDRINLRFNLSRKGISFQIPIINGVGKEHLAFTEEWMFRLLEKLLLVKDGTFIDVGVNLGQTLLKVKSIDPSRAYLGFEPNPACVYYTNELKRLNKFEDTEIVPVGLAEVNGVFVLNHYSDGDFDSSASIMADFRDQKVYRRTYVPCFTFDTVVSQLKVGPIGLVKIDVEGAEHLVLETLQSVLAIQRAMVIVEILPAYSIDNHNRVNNQLRIMNILKNIKYKLLYIDKSRLEFNILDQIPIDQSIADSDYLLCPEELVETIVKATN